MRPASREPNLCLAVLFTAGLSWGHEVKSRYDVIIIGSGLKQSLLAGLLATHGKQVLQLDPSGEDGGSDASLDLQQLADAMDASVNRGNQLLRKFERANR